MLLHLMKGSIICYKMKLTSLKTEKAVFFCLGYSIHLSKRTLLDIYARQLVLVYMITVQGMERQKVKKFWLIILRDEFGSRVNLKNSCLWIRVKQ